MYPSQESFNPYVVDYSYYLTTPTLGNHNVTLPDYLYQLAPPANDTIAPLLNCLIDEVQQQVGTDPKVNITFSILSRNHWYNEEFHWAMQLAIAYYAGLHYLKRLDKNDAIVKTSNELALVLRHYFYHDAHDGVVDDVKTNTDDVRFWFNKLEEIKGLGQYYLDHGLTTI